MAREDTLKPHKTMGFISVTVEKAMQAICSDWTKDKLTEMAAQPQASLASLAVFVFVVTGCSSQFTH